jgi:hypothetical protein
MKQDCFVDRLQVVDWRASYRPAEAKAGLRAAEIAKLSWDMVLDPGCEVGGTIELQDKIAKKGGGRSIPLHADLQDVLAYARRRCDGRGPIVRSERGGAMTPRSIVV